MHITHIHTHTHAAKQHIHSLTQPWNPLRLGDLAKQLIHSAFDLFPISSLQSANWEKQKRKGDCCTSPRDQTKERSRDTHRMSVCDVSLWISICRHRSRLIIQCDCVYLLFDLIHCDWLQFNPLCVVWCFNMRVTYPYCLYHVFCIHSGERNCIKSCLWRA